MDKATFLAIGTDKKVSKKQMLDIAKILGYKKAIRDSELNHYYFMHETKTKED